MFDMLSESDQSRFNDYKIVVVTLKNVTDKSDFFRRLNYTLQPTPGERLHACNTKRSNGIQQFFERHKRSKTFERMCVLFYLEVEPHAWKRFGLQAGLKGSHLHPHSLRHSYRCMPLQLGNSAEVVSKNDQPRKRRHHAKILPERKRSRSQ